MNLKQIELMHFLFIFYFIAEEKKAIQEAIKR